MRKITDHRLDNGDFHDAFQRVVRNSPWWLLSAIAHGVALAVLWSIPMPVNGKYTPVIQSSIADKPPEMDEIDVEPPEPVQKQEKIDEAPPEDPDVEPADTAEVPIEAPLDEGDPDKPWTGPSQNTAIGLTGGAGGHGGGKRGSRKTDIKGGDGRTLVNVLDGLKWLADHQDVRDDGRWDCDDFMKHDPADDKCDGPGSALHDIGVSGLALLAFLGADYTDRGTHPFARHVRKGLRFLTARTRTVSSAAAPATATCTATRSRRWRCARPTG
ncbi:MAG: hypothetical protein ACYTGI_09310 [Planctomycetota bacterium]|jgi:hypothetical protein